LKDLLAVHGVAKLGAMKKFCYADGKLVETAKARVAVNDVAVLRGYGCFDFLKTVNGRPLLWREHWQRFGSSAKALGLKVPVGEGEALEIVSKLFKKNKITKGEDASIRLVLTGGPTADGVTLSQPQFFILLEDIYKYPAKVFARGVKLITHDYLRLVPGAKTTNYLAMMRLQKEKKKAGALEILFTDRGRVLECSTSNFFIIKNSKLITAKEDVLGGTVRNKVIALARQAGIEVEEREVKVEELKTADEAFLTATNKDVTPVVQIDDLKIGNGKVGELTKKVMALYLDFLKNN
jgi:branched-subunit amino acid aminotransferase/4-amino-4-deoxychorismate lyase